MRSPLRIGFHVIYEFAAVPPIHTMRTGTADSHFALVKRSDNYKCSNDKNNNRNYLLEKGISRTLYNNTLRIVPARSPATRRSTRLQSIF